MHIEEIERLVNGIALPHAGCSNTGVSAVPGDGCTAAVIAVIAPVASARHLATPPLAAALASGTQAAALASGTQAAALASGTQAAARGKAARGKAARGKAAPPARTTARQSQILRSPPFISTWCNIWI